LKSACQQLTIIQYNDPKCDPIFPISGGKEDYAAT